MKKILIFVLCFICEVPTLVHAQVDPPPDNEAKVLIFQNSSLSECDDCTTTTYFDSIELSNEFFIYSYCPEEKKLFHFDKSQNQWKKIEVPNPDTEKKFFRNFELNLDVQANIIVCIMWEPLAVIDEINDMYFITESPFPKYSCEVSSTFHIINCSVISEN
jgi:hypothetical protein